MPHLDRATPSSHGVPDRALLALLDELENGLDPHALIVARHGRVLLSAAWRPYRADSAALVYSVSKTPTALAVALLVDEGRLTFDDPVEAHLDVPNPHGFTLRHLLTMSTGHSRDQTLAMPFSAHALMTTTPEHPPGTHFAYSSPASFVLGQVVTAVSGERLGDYLRPRLLEPLGIGPRWWLDLDGFDQGFSGLHLSVDDLARLTLLLAQDGRWEGRQLVRAATVHEMTWVESPLPSDDDAPALDPGNGEPVPVGDWAQGYGLHLWRSRFGFRLDGAYGQLGVAVPERGLVVAVLGATTQTQRTLDAFWALLERVEDAPLAEDPDDAAALAERLAGLDSWEARETLAPGDSLDVQGWALDDDDAAGDAWRLTVSLGPLGPSGSDSDTSGSDAPTSVATIAVPSDSWAHARIPHAGGVLPVAARGERRPDGSVLVHLVVTTSPHRILLVRDPAGHLDAHWHTTPLWWPRPETLLAPSWVADPATAPDPTPEP